MKERYLLEEEVGENGFSLITTMMAMTNMRLM